MQLTTCTDTLIFPGDIPLSKLRLEITAHHAEDKNVGGKVEGGKRMTDNVCACGCRTIHAYCSLL